MGRDVATLYGGGTGNSPGYVLSGKQENNTGLGHMRHISSYEYSEEAVFQGSAVLILLSQKSLLLLLILRNP